MNTSLMIFLLLFSGHHTENIQNDKVYDMTVVDEPPEFIGGMAKFYTFLIRNFNYPKDEDHYMGNQIYLSFIVEKNGKLTNVRIKKSAYPKIEAETLKVLKKSPAWKPGQNNGEPVRVKYSTFIRLEPIQ